MQLKGLALVACFAAFAMTTLQASSASLDKAKSRPAAPPAAAPDFWYVIHGDAAATTSTDLVSGIVIPSSANPSVQTTPAGSVMSWQRPDGTRQSFAVHGVSSLTFKPGPLKGTTYVPFVDARRLQYNPDHDPKSCCACASWQDSEESVERLSCVIGCAGCGCEGCICSPTYPCPDGPSYATTLRPNNDSSPAIRFDKSRFADAVSVGSPIRGAVQFRGKRLSAKVASDGSVEVVNPESITIPGHVVASSIVRRDRELFAWTSPDTTVILEQPKGMPAPSLEGGTIDLHSGLTNAPGTAALRLEPLMDRCIVCGTHPNSDGDSERCECVPGTQTCTRCINFLCDAPEL